jgi:uncharacterized protein
MRAATVKDRSRAPSTGVRATSSAPAGGAATPRWVPALWTAYLVVAFLALDVLELATWGWVVPLVAVGLVLATSSRLRGAELWRVCADRRDLVWIAGLYVVVVGLLRLAFVGFGTTRLVGLFLSYAAALLVGVLGPIVYTVWVRGRTLRELGIGGHNLRATLVLGGLLAAVQFALTVGRVDFPAYVDWVPLAVMSLMVGLFEAVFFRGFVQRRLQASFGSVAGVAGAAALYSLYHVGYGMGVGELVFLFGLGVVYAIAFRLVDNLLVLWPLLTPVGAFFNNLQAGDIELPWASIAGFADVLAVMAVGLWLAWRHQRRRAAAGQVADS